MPKHRDIKSLLKSRIRQGDYHARPFPSTVKLAAELNVDRRTASKAMNTLVQDGLLVRMPSGRIAPAPARQGEKLHLAVVAPTYPTPFVANRFATLERLAAQRGWDIRLVSYAHDHDAVIYESIDGFDALFLVPLADDFPPEVIAKLRAGATKAVALFEDLSAHGIPSLRFENPATVHKLLSHLYERGYRSVACINTQPPGHTVSERINQWQLWKSVRKTTGPLIDEPVKHFYDAMLQARAVTTRRLRESALDVQAIFCTTGYAAIGVMRALADHGLAPGKDIAVCAADGAGPSGLCMIPSLTSPIDPSYEPYFEMFLDWFASDQPQWTGPLLVQSVESDLFIGESTAPALPPQES